jgi:[ribosomal protein S18]-alanine N-acetyltransferase
MRRILAHIEFRLAIPADAMTISEMSRDLIETGLGWSWTRRRVDHAIRNRDTLAVAAMQGSEMAGFGIMEFGDETAHLSLFAVRMELQRRGIGTAMFEWLKQSALTAGIGRIRLELRALNGQAEAFYRALGFAQTARVPGYYRGREHALRMALDLRKSRR